MEFRINWSGRSDFYTQEELDIICSVAKYADPQTKGRYLSEFENLVSTYLNLPVVSGVSSASGALEMIASMSRLKAGDEVVLPAHTYCATAIPFGRRGAQLVWADIDKDTRVISLESVKKCVTEKTKVVVAVHLYGLPAPANEIAEFCEQRNILFVEDCAQAFGASIGKTKVGSFGDFAAFSLHAQKNISTLGEGGIIASKHAEYSQTLQRLRHNGHLPYPEPREHYWLPAMADVDAVDGDIWPHNFPFTEVQAALGCKLIGRLDELNQIRIKRAEQFQLAMKEFPELSFQRAADNVQHVYHLLSAKYDSKNQQVTRDNLIDRLSSVHKIKCAIQYYPLYRYPLFQKFGFAQAECPNTDEFYDNMISFPFHVHMTAEDFSYLIDAVQESLYYLRTL